MFRTSTFIFAFLLLMLCSSAMAKNRYDIELKIDYKSHTIHGKAKVDFVNVSSRGIDSLVVLLYPNVHKNKSPFLDDINFPWIYPGNFDPGWLEIKRARAGGFDLPFKYFDKEGMPESTVLKVQLPRELGPGESGAVEFEYEARIPRKFGPYGYYRKDILLNGGFYPYLASLKDDGEWSVDSYPQSSDFRLKVYGRGVFLVNGISPKPAGGQSFEIEFEDRDYLSLYNTRKVFTEEVTGRRINARIYFHRKELESSKPILRDLAGFINFVEGLDEFGDLSGELVFCESYLRDRLIAPSDGVVYFSDRTHKLFAPIRTYHSLEILRGFMYSVLRGKIRKKETDSDYDWVISTLARFYTEAYLRDYHSKLKRDARKIGLVRLFSFLPELDQVIYAPQFPFTSVYYDSIYTYDYFRLDILDYNRVIRSKNILYEKIKDKYSGYENFRDFFKSYVQNRTDFRSGLKEYFGEDSLRLIDWWLGPYPSVNYSLKGIERKRKEGGGFENKIKIAKETQSNLEEPLTVYLKEYGGTTTGKRHLKTWDGAGKETELYFDTEKRLRTVHLDPYGRLLEYKLDDNRSPALYKWILTSYSVGLDINSASANLGLSTTFRKLYGSNNRYTLAGYSEEASYGGSVGYTRLFGRLLDDLRLSHGMAVSYRIDGLKNDYIVFVSRGDDPSAAFYDQIQVGRSGRTAMLFFQYFFGNMLSYENPKSGMSAVFYAGFAGKYLGGDSAFYKTGFSWSGVFPLDRSNLLALKCEFGTSGADGIPPQQQYALGGLYSMKGFPRGEISRVGRNKILLSAEYRHYLAKDIDINFFWLFRIRNIMGAFFADAGRVSGTVLEYARHLSYGSAFSASPHHLFNIKEYDADFGYGIRFLYDILGIKESVLSFDVAKSATDFKLYGVRFYIYFAQSF